MSEPALGRDVLTAGPDEPERPSVLARVLGAALVLAALLALPSDVRTPPRPSAGEGGDPLQLVLRAGGTRLLPARGVWRTQTEDALVVEVVNQGPRTVTITSATLTPGLWQVRVLDDGTVPPRSRTSLALQRLVDCRRGIDDAQVPEDLVLVATVDGRSVLRRVAVRDLHASHGERLTDAMRAASGACAVRQGYDTG